MDVGLGLRGSPRHGRHYELSHVTAYARQQVDHLHNTRERRILNRFRAGKIPLHQHVSKMLHLHVSPELHIFLPELGLQARPHLPQESRTQGFSGHAAVGHVFEGPQWPTTVADKIGLISHGTNREQTHLRMLSTSLGGRKPCVALTAPEALSGKS